MAMLLPFTLLQRMIRLWHTWHLYLCNGLKYVLWKTLHPDDLRNTNCWTWSMAFTLAVYSRAKSRSYEYYRKRPNRTNRYEPICEDAHRSSYALTRIARQRQTFKHAFFRELQRRVEFYSTFSSLWRIVDMCQVSLGNIRNVSWPPE
jgi:hypothetical protein